MEIAKNCDIGQPRIVCTVKEKKRLPYSIHAMQWKDFLAWFSE